MVSLCIGWSGASGMAWAEPVIMVRTKAAAIIVRVIIENLRCFERIDQPPANAMPARTSDIAWSISPSARSRWPPLFGFNDLSYFNRCFRRRFGLTPTAARGNNRA